MKSIVSPSIMCADPLCMLKDLDYLAQMNIPYFHCDVMDGHFVPNLMLSTETVKAVKKRYAKPIDLHLMVEKPERMIPWFPTAKGDIVSIHYESTPHIHRALAMIRERGASPALALNPGTPIECARDLLSEIDVLLMMTVDPGFAAQPMIPSALDKIARARKMLNDCGRADVPIEVDGNCSLANIPKMEAAGANVFVVGSSSVFSAAYGIEKGLKMTLDCLTR